MTTEQDCQATAPDFDSATKSRSVELEALGKARTRISETTGDTVIFSYGVSSVVSLNAFIERRSMSFWALAMILTKRLTCHTWVRSVLRIFTSIVFSL